MNLNLCRDEVECDRNSHQDYMYHLEWCEIEQANIEDRFPLRTLNRSISLQ